MVNPCPSSPSRAEAGTRTPVKEDLGRGLTAQPQLAVDLAALEPRRARRHQERGDTLGARPAGAGEEEADVGPGAVRDEDLLAVDDVVVTVAHGLGPEVPGIRPGVGLGQPEAAKRLTRGDLAQPVLLLLLRAVAEDRLADQAHRHRDDAAHRRVGPAELLHAKAVGDVVAADAAVLLGDRQAKEAQLRQLRQDRCVHLLGTVPGRAMGHDLVVKEFAGQRPERLLLLVQGQVHQISSAMLSGFTVSCSAVLSGSAVLSCSSLVPCSS